MPGNNKSMKQRDSVGTIVLLTVNETETTVLMDTFLGKGKTPEQETKAGLTYNHLVNT